MSGELENFEYKVIMPSNEKIGKEACGFANIENGGLLIFGISDDAVLYGLPDDKWDEYQNRLTNILTSTLNPCPEFKILKFPLKDSENKIFVLDIKELANKPCLYKDKVYIRKRNSAKPATSDDIRQMILKRCRSW